MNVPMFFEGEDGTEYKSAGVVVASIKDVMEEYLLEISDFHTELAPDFAAWLRAYADKLDALCKL